MIRRQDQDAERYRENERRKRLDRQQVPGSDEEPLPPPVAPIRTSSKAGRNEPCPCGSGKKYKQCCGKKAP